MKRLLSFLLLIALAGLLAARTRHGYVPVSGGARLYYEERGTGEPLILLHGHSLDTRMWDFQFRVFARRYRVVSFDFRGYGRSSAQTEGFQFTHLDDMLTLMDSLHIRRAHIVGLSMGAFIAGDMLGIAPERMLSCVLASGGPKKQPGPSEPMDSAEWARRDREITELRAKGVETMKKEWLEGLISSGGSNRESMRRPLRRMISRWTAWQPLHHEARVLYGNDAVRLIRSCHPAVPTLVLEGGAPGNRHSGRSWLSDVMPDVWVQELPDCGHMMNMEQPDAFNRAVLEFLNRLP